MILAEDRAFNLDKHLADTEEAIITLREAHCEVPSEAYEIRGMIRRAIAAEQLLRDIAWRVSDFATANWSGADVLAHVADHFGVDVKTLLEGMR